MKKFYLGFLISFFIFDYGFKIMTVKIKNIDMFIMVYIIEPLAHLVPIMIVYFIVKKLFFR